MVVMMMMMMMVCAGWVVVVDVVGKVFYFLAIVFGPFCIVGGVIDFWTMTSGGAFWLWVLWLLSWHSCI